MNYQEITKLLDKYFEGETSLEEETQLRDYFNTEEVHPTLRKYRSLFQYFQSEREQRLDKLFEERLLQQLQQTTQPRLRVRQLTTWVARAAAVVLMALGVWWIYEQTFKPAPEPVAQAIDWSKYEPKTPEEAYQILRTSLVKASTKLNEGANTAAQEMGKMHKMTEIIQ